VPPLPAPSVTRSYSSADEPIVVVEKLAAAVVEKLAAAWLWLCWRPLAHTWCGEQLVAADNAAAARARSRRQALGQALKHSRLCIVGSDRLSELLRCR
jgi:hypothetical protein